MLERRHIEMMNDEMVAQNLTEAFDKYCSRQGPSVLREEYEKMVHARQCGSSVPLFDPVLCQNSALLAWDVDDDDVHAARCDQAALGKFSGVARKHPTFPFAHYALAICALSNEDPTWRQHAERALAILEHTTQIAGRAGAHDQAYEFLLARLAGEQ